MTAVEELLTTNIKIIRNPNDERLGMLSAKFLDDDQLEKEFGNYIWTNGFYMLRIVLVVISVLTSSSLMITFSSSFLPIGVELMARQGKVNVSNPFIKIDQNAYDNLDTCPSDDCLADGEDAENNNDYTFIMLLAIQTTFLAIYSFIDHHPYENFKIMFYMQTVFTSVMLSSLLVFDLLFISCDGMQGSYVEQLTDVLPNQIKGFINNRVQTVCVGRFYGTGTLDHQLGDVVYLCWMPLIAISWSMLYHVRWLHIIIATVGIYYDCVDSGSPVEASLMHVVNCVLLSMVVLHIERAVRHEFLMKRWMKNKHKEERQNFRNRKIESENRAAKVIARLDRAFKNSMRLCLPDVPIVTKTLLEILVTERDRLLKNASVSPRMAFLEISKNSSKQFQFVDTVRFSTVSFSRFNIGSGSLKDELERSKKSPKEKTNSLNGNTSVTSQDDIVREYGSMIVKQPTGSLASISSKNSSQSEAEEECIAKYFNIEDVFEHDPLWNESECCAEFLKRLQQACEIDHKNILRVVGYTFQPRLAIFHEPAFLIGREVFGLKRLMEKNPTQILRIEFIIDVMHQIASAIEYLHANGICHGQITLDTILLVSIDKMESEATIDSDGNDDHYSKMIQGTVKLDLIDCNYFVPNHFRLLAPETNTWHYSGSHSSSLSNSIQARSSELSINSNSNYNGNNNYINKPIERVLSKEFDVFQFGVCMWQLLHDSLDSVMVGNQAALTFDTRLVNANSGMLKQTHTVEQQIKKVQSIPKELQFLTIDCLSKDPEQRPTIYYIKHTLIYLRQRVFGKL